MTNDQRPYQTTPPPQTPAGDVFDDVARLDDVADAEAARHRRERMIARLRLLWEHRGSVCRVAACGVAIAVVVALLIPARYEATTRLMPPESQSNSAAAALASIAGSSGLSAMAGSLLGTKSTGPLFVGILGSRSIQDRLIDEFDLMTVYGVARRESAREALAGQTSVSEDRRSGIISISVQDGDPELAARLAAGYATALDRLVVELTTSEASRERVFLEERLRTVKQDLDAAATAFSEFASEHATLDIRDQGRAMVEAAATLQGELIAAQTELEGLRQIYADGHVRIRSAQARVAELRNQLDRMGGDSIVLNTADGSAADASLYPTIRELPLLGVTYADLYRRTRVQETVFELLTQQYELAKVQEAKEIPSVKVLDPAVVPDRKSFPPRTLIVLAGALLSLAASTIWVLGRARWNEIEANSPGRQFVEEVLATLQADANRLASSALGATRWNGNGHAASHVVNGHHGNGLRPVSLVLSDPGRSGAGEESEAGSDKTSAPHAVVGTGFALPDGEAACLKEPTRP